MDGDGDLDVLGAAMIANSIVWWENDLIPGIEENGYTTVEYFDRFPTVINGALPLKLLTEHKVLDITGRRIDSDNPQPGIYFIVCDDRHMQKIIKVR
jgi:hypothetical protein